MCLGMKIPGEDTTNFITINEAADSLHSLIADEQFRSTTVGRDTWKMLFGSQGSLQYNCNREGFNAKCHEHQGTKARIGIIGNKKTIAFLAIPESGLGQEGVMTTPTLVVLKQSLPQITETGTLKPWDIS